MAKAYKLSGHTVLGFDKDTATQGYASLAGIIDGELNEKNVSECDLIFIALYPQAAIKYLEGISPLLSKESVIIDLCGTKKQICRRGFDLADKYGFTFVGGHPMAGVQYSGIKYAKATMDIAYKI
jgi:prephenate dehydrogenase